MEESIMDDTVVERTPHKAQLEEGVYDAIIQRVEAQKDVQTSYGIKDMIVVTYDIDGIEIRRRYNKSWNKGSALFKLVSDLRPGEVLTTKYDVAVLEGAKVRVLIGHNKTDDGGEWDNIMQVTLPQKPAPVMATKAAQSLEELANDPELTDDEE
jgi:hypothetical protein